MTPQQAIEDLIEAGLLARWWCAACEDYVLYRTLEMTEDASRRLHGESHASA